MTRVWSENPSRAMICSAMVAVMLLTGCSSVGLGGANDPSLTPEERKMRESMEDYNQTILFSSVIGCLAAIAAARLAGIAEGGVGGEDLAACALGLAAGAGVGYFMAEKKKEYQTQYEYHDAILADVRAENEKLAGAINNADAVIAADRQRINEVRQSMAVGTMSKEQAEKSLESVDKNTEFLRDTIESLRERVVNWQEVLKEVKTDDPTRANLIEAEIRKLQGQIAYLEGEVNQVAEARIVTVS